jgi:acetyl/propionyl-CoA carboxylase alpha subunit
VTAPRFRTLLVANRGEVACRILRSARGLGLRTISVYSDADREALHVRLADRAVRIGPGPSGASYLDIEAVLAAARQAGAEAIHPGYGFLAENPAFARACEAAGIVFVGPSSRAIEALGNKTAAKQVARRLGVPCLPGADERDGADLVQQARRLGAPLMIKAAGGGGGRGMRRVDDIDRFEAELASARAEAQAAFGNPEMLVERCMDDARRSSTWASGTARASDAARR